MPASTRHGTPSGLSYADRIWSLGGAGKGALPSIHLVSIRPPSGVDHKCRQASQAETGPIVVITSPEVPRYVPSPLHSPRYLEIPAPPEPLDGRLQRPDPRFSRPSWFYNMRCSRSSYHFEERRVLLQGYNESTEALAPSSSRAGSVCKYK